MKSHVAKEHTKTTRDTTNASFVRCMPILPKQAPHQEIVHAILDMLVKTAKRVPPAKLASIKQDEGMVLVRTARHLRLLLLVAKFSRNARVLLEPSAQTVKLANYAPLASTSPNLDPKSVWIAFRIPTHLLEATHRRRVHVM